MTTTIPQIHPDQALSRPAPGLPGRLAALDQLVELGSGRVDQNLIQDAGAVLARAGQRLRLSGDHTVVALAGGTGSGKSSLFNAVCGLDLSPVDVRRPTTASTHACVWGLEGAGPLLDWLAVDKRYRYARASALGGEESTLQGLVLLDLPDHDSVRTRHSDEVDRFVAVADLLVWVLDPQKYADAALHRRYIEPFAGHAGVTVVVLNQVDRLASDEINECVGDLHRLLRAEGLRDPRILTTSAVDGTGVDGFREVLIDTVAARRARTERLTADIDVLLRRFEADYGTAAPPSVDERRATALIESLSEAAGVPAVAEAMQSAYELRAVDYVGWPLARVTARLRSDPLRSMRLTELRDELRGAFTGPIGAQQSDIDNALQGVTEGITQGLPDAWQRAVRRAARSHADELPETLGRSLIKVVPAFNQVPGWWWAVKTWQYTLIALVGLGMIWLGALFVFDVLKLGDPPSPLVGDTGLMPYVVLLLGCALGLGGLTSSACRNIIGLSSTGHSERMEDHMREGVAEVAAELVLVPVERELGVYARFREVLFAVATR